MDVFVVSFWNTKILTPQWRFRDFYFFKMPPRRGVSERFRGPNPDLAGPGGIPPPTTPTWPHLIHHRPHSGPNPGPKLDPNLGPDLSRAIFATCSSSPPAHLRDLLITKSKQRATSTEQRATSIEQQAYSNEQRATSNEQQATSSKQRAASISREVGGSGGSP